MRCGIRDGFHGRNVELWYSSEAGTNAGCRRQARSDFILCMPKEISAGEAVSVDGQVFFDRFKTLDYDLILIDFTCAFGFWNARLLKGTMA